MTTYRSAADAISAFTSTTSRTIEQSIRELLETKHLYQSVVVNVDAVSKGLLPLVESKSREGVESWIADATTWPWIVTDDDNLQAIVTSFTTKSEGQTLVWTAPDIKIYCETCARLEPFNRVTSANFLNRSNPKSGGILQGKTRIQTYVLSYLCQSCKSIPEVFLVRRSGKKLTLSGRAPMEHVQVPKCIPKEVAKHYSGSVVAYQSGQTLAGLFLLRTLCEQWARRYAESNDKADVAIDKYMQSLPDDFRARFPSVRNIYSDLSAALHSANASDDLYASTLAAVSEHFKARQLYRL